MYKIITTLRIIRNMELIRRATTIIMDMNIQTMALSTRMMEALNTTTTIIIMTSMLRMLLNLINKTNITLRLIFIAIKPKPINIDILNCF